MILISPSSLVLADGLVLFDIKQQRADKGIIAFAQKVNKTIVFSFDLTKQYQTNNLKGYYSIEAGLSKLLGRTGLIAAIDSVEVVL